MKKLHSTTLTILVCFLTSCASPIPIKNSNQSDPEIRKPIVLTTFTVLADIAKNVAGERLEVNSITKVGSEIHGYQPTPSDIIRASKAQLIVENGLGLELWSKKFIISAGDIPTVVLSEGIKPLLIEEDIYAGKPNPHVWMSPKKAIYYVDKLVNTFIKIDPVGEATYINNGKLYKAKLIELDKELRSAILKIPANKRVLVSCEGAFSYLAKDYGMEEAYLWPVNAESQVTPKRMVKLINTIKEKEIPTIFCESTVSSKPQRQVAKQSGANFGGNFYVDSLSTTDGPAPTFIELLRHNVRLIVKGLSPNS